MANIAQAKSTQTAYRVTLTNPQGHTWYADEPSDTIKVVKILHRIQFKFYYQR